MTVCLRGRGRGSGAEIDARFYDVYTVSEGKIVRMDQFKERSEAPRSRGTVGVALLPACVDKLTLFSKVREASRLEPRSRSQCPCSGPARGDPRDRPPPERNKSPAGARILDALRSCCGRRLTRRSPLSRSPRGRRSRPRRSTTSSGSGRRSGKHSPNGSWMSPSGGSRKRALCPLRIGHEQRQRDRRAVPRGPDRVTAHVLREWEDSGLVPGRAPLNDVRGAFEDARADGVLRLDVDIRMLAAASARRASERCTSGPPDS